MGMTFFFETQLKILFGQFFTIYLITLQITYSNIYQRRFLNFKPKRNRTCTQCVCILLNLSEIKNHLLSLNLYKLRTIVVGWFPFWAHNVSLLGKLTKYLPIFNLSSLNCKWNHRLLPSKLLFALILRF